MVLAGHLHTYTTDANGQVVFAVGMERNPDFDDDGQATSHVSVTALGQSETKDVDFNAGVVLNPGQLTVTATAVTQADLPEVQTRERAAYDVVALDQFGNRTKLSYNATDNSPDADIAFADDGSSPCVSSASAGARRSTSASRRALWPPGARRPSIPSRWRGTRRAPTSTERTRTPALPVFRP